MSERSCRLSRCSHSLSSLSSFDSVDFCTWEPIRSPVAVVTPMLAPPASIATPIGVKGVKTSAEPTTDTPAETALAVRTEASWKSRSREMRSTVRQMPRASSRSSEIVPLPSLMSLSPPCSSAARCVSSIESTHAVSVERARMHRSVRTTSAANQIEATAYPSSPASHRSCARAGAAPR